MTPQRSLRHSSVCGGPAHRHFIEFPANAEFMRGLERALSEFSDKIGFGYFVKNGTAIFYAAPSRRSLTRIILSQRKL